MFRTRTGRVSHVTAATATIMVAVLAGCEPDVADTGAPGPATTAAPAVGPAINAPAAGPATERPVDAETLPYADVNERLVYGYFAFPSDMVEPLPALVLVHDWWGLDEEMHAAANRIAAAGYIVLAVDLYSGETITAPGAAREKAIAVVENPKAIEENIRQALDFVEVAGAPAIGIAGWGFGGAYALDAALAFPDRIDAVVVFYGQVPSESDRLATLGSPVLGLFGDKDTTVTPKAALAFAAATNRIGKPAEVEIYPDAGHGFADPRRRQYDPSVAARAWTRMLEFLSTALVADES